MASGGARAHPGPVQDPMAIRHGKDGAKGWIHLAAEGRQGDPPTWPLIRPTVRELVLWDQEWRRPQAIVWDNNGQQLEVALYVRAVRIAENPKASSGDRTLVKQLQEILGLSLNGLAKNHWIIDLPASAQPQAVATAGTPGAPNARDRLKVMSHGA